MKSTRRHYHMRYHTLQDIEGMTDFIHGLRPITLYTDAPWVSVYLGLLAGFRKRGLRDYVPSSLAPHV